jgi:hypothetical protein
MPIADPSARHLSAASPVVVVGEGHAPVVAVPVAAVKGRSCSTLTFSEFGSGAIDLRHNLIRWLR